jgi:hypothetical protein
VALMIRRTLGWCDEHGRPQNERIALSYSGRLSFICGLFFDSPDLWVPFGSGCFLVAAGLVTIQGTENQWRKRRAAPNALSKRSPVRKRRMQLHFYRLPIRHCSLRARKLPLRLAPIWKL